MFSVAPYFIVLICLSPVGLCTREGKSSQNISVVSPQSKKKVKIGDVLEFRVIITTLYCYNVSCWRGKGSLKFENEYWSIQ